MTLTRTSGLSRAASAAWVIAGLVLVRAGGDLRADEGHGPDTAQAHQAVQTRCPVMKGNQINPDLFTTYQGKKVYFCCTSCRSTFEKDPKKYLSLLPQFGGAMSTAGQDHGDKGHRHGGFTAADLIVPTGILTLSLVTATTCLGLLRRLKPRPLLRWHKRLGPVALISGVAHAALVLLAH